MPKQPRLDLTFEQDPVFEEGHSRRNVVSGTMALDDSLELFRGEYIGRIEIDMIFEDGFWS